MGKYHRRDIRISSGPGLASGRRGLRPAWVKGADLAQREACHA